MPVIIVYGMPHNVDQSKLENVMIGLRSQVAAHLKLSLYDVSVFFNTDLLHKGIGEELVCFVDGVFEKPERTTVVRQEMAEACRYVLRSFAKNNGLPQCKKVEVFVKRFNQETDGFAVWCAKEKK